LSHPSQILQVKVDVERSLHSFASFLTSEEREARREELQRLLNAVVVKHGGKREGLQPAVQQ
jgi:hypothetical protein